MKILMLSVAAVGAQLVMPVADRVPVLKIDASCRAAATADASQRSVEVQTFDACMRDEDSARRELEPIWLNYASPDRDSCEKEATGGGSPSYVELLVCLQIRGNTTAVAPTSLRGARKRKP